MGDEEVDAWTQKSGCHIRDTRFADYALGLGHRTDDADDAALHLNICRRLVP